jgi:hypothetical protein
MTFAPMPNNSFAAEQLQRSAGVVDVFAGKVRDLNSLARTAVRLRKDFIQYSALRSWLVVLQSPYVGFCQFSSPGQAGAHQSGV